MKFKSEYYAYVRETQHFKQKNGGGGGGGGATGHEESSQTQLGTFAGLVV